eukprot:11547219-Karenia_brevis.AAC.1
MFADATSFTNDEIVNIIKNVVKESEFATWIMLKKSPRREVCLVSPMRMLDKYAGGKLCESSYNMNLGPEHVGAPRIIHDLSDTLPEDGITREIWPVLVRALMHLMPDSMIDSLYSFADTKALKAAYRDGQDRASEA